MLKSSNAFNFLFQPNLTKTYLPFCSKGPKPSKQAFDEKMAQFLTHPELQKGSDKFYESITSFTIQNARTKTFAGRLTCIKKSGIAEIVYCEAVNGVFTVFKDEKKVRLKKIY